MYAAALQTCELSKGALLGIRGHYTEKDIYQTDEAAATEFDKNFPSKQKSCGTPSQKKFEKTVAMRRKAF